MGRVNTNLVTPNGEDIFYEIFDDGFDIYFGETTKHPSWRQREPYIPYRGLSYEENAIKFAKTVSSEAESYVPKQFVYTEEMYNEMQANIDYLLILAE